MADSAGAPGGEALPGDEATCVWVLERLPDPAAIVQDDAIVYANQAAGELFGLSSGAELLGRTAVGVVHPDYREISAERFAQVSQGATLPPVSIAVVAADGTSRTIESRMAPFVFGGRPATLVVARDISARLAAEGALRESEERCRAFTEAAFEGLAITEAGVVVDANPELGRMLNTPHAAIVGRRALDFVAPESRALVSEQMEAGAEGPYEHLALRSDGTPFPVSVRARTIEYQGRPARLTALRDITARHREQAEQERLHQRLAQAEKARSLTLMAGGVAHDFNNLLTAVMGHLEIAQSLVPTHSPVARHLEAIGLSVQRAAKLTGQMLAFTGRLWLVRETVNLDELVADVVAAAGTPGDGGCRVEVEPSAHPPLCQGDPDQLRQVLAGLLANAYEATEGADGLIRIRVDTGPLDCGDRGAMTVGSPDPSGWFVRVDMTDNGSGIAADTLHRIFDPFFSTKFTGRGLTLAAGLGIVQAHEGAIEVSSVPGEGSRFRVCLPFDPGGA
ncbi:MAG: PAS domain S-box protein [Armatimonadetes bacterium]|nr:PAS domain S-box protein [Armatimonadota bacterium]